MKNLFKEAHKMTREIKEKYPEVDYQAQFGLCISFLLEEEKEEEEMKELHGTEKQIKWAKDILGREITWYRDIKASADETERRLKERGGEKAEYYLEQLGDYKTAIEIAHNTITEETWASEIIYLGENLNGKDNPCRVMSSLISKLVVKGKLENEELLLDTNQVVANFSRTLWKK